MIPPWARRDVVRVILTIANRVDKDGEGEGEGKVMKWFTRMDKESGGPGLKQAKLPGFSG